jgi:phospholipase/carboxylesterase
MQFSLNTIVIKPEKNVTVKNAVILLHGYGGDAKDISMLTLNWKRFLPNTVFLCPDAHEVCSINPSGFQWFDLSKDDADYILQESLKAEKKLLNYINEVKEIFKLESKRICISGFSQGCMLSINVGLTSHENLACIVGFSGKIINKDNLLKRKKSNTNFLLIHGELDEVVDPSNLLEAKDFLMRHNIDVQTHIIAACGHNIPVEASSLALAFIKENFNRL